MSNSALLGIAGIGPQTLVKIRSLEPDPDNIDALKEVVQMPKLPGPDTCSCNRPRENERCAGDESVPDGIEKRTAYFVRTASSDGEYWYDTLAKAKRFKAFEEWAFSNVDMDDGYGAFLNAFDESGEALCKALGVDV